MQERIKCLKRYLLPHWMLATCCWLYSQVREPPSWLRWIEIAAVLVVMGGIALEIWVVLPAERKLDNVRLHATVASLSTLGHTEETSYAVQKILSLMHRNGVDMTGISFPGVKFRMAEIDHADPTKRFTGMAEFDGVNWSDAHMNGVNFGCSKRIKDLQGYSLSHPFFVILSTIPIPASGPLRYPCMHIRYGRFDGASLQDVRFQQVDLSYASFAYAKLTGLKAQDTNFFGTRFLGSVKPTPFSEMLHFPIFDCSNIAPNKDNCVRLKNVGFVESDLRYARFLGVDISRANFAHSKLDHAKFGCFLEQSIHSSNKFECVIMSSIDRTCFDRAGLNGAKFSDTIITNSDFSHAKLSGVQFDRVTFENVVFSEEQKAEVKFDQDSEISLDTGMITADELQEMVGVICD